MGQIYSKARYDSNNVESGADLPPRSSAGQKSMLGIMGGLVFVFFEGLFGPSTG